MKVCTVEQLVGMRQQAREVFGLSPLAAMEGAAVEVARAALRLAVGPGRPIVLLCGPRFEGGAALAAARRLQAAGAEPIAAVLCPAEELDQAVAEHLEGARRCGVELLVDPGAEQVASAVRGAAVVVDAIAGGVELSGRQREVVEAIAGLDASVLAVGLPAGVDGDTGRVGDVVLAADQTILLGLPALGHLLTPGFHRCGQLGVTDLGWPPELTGAEAVRVEVELPPPLPPRRPDGHKGTFGDVLTIAGAATYYGAPTFAALAVLRAGAGYSRLAAPGSIIPRLAPLCPEVVFAPQDETDGGSLALGAAEGLLELSEVVDFVILGPGLSLHDETQALARRLVAELDRPLLIDGDGLTAVASELEVVRQRRAPTVLTPHPGEMSRLTGQSVGQLRRDPVGALRALATDLGAVVVYKVANSLIGLPDGRVFINVSGSSALGTAGSGDVLTGTVAAAFGLGLEVEAATRAGVFLHGFSGDLAAEALGADGVGPLAVLDHLPAAVQTYRREWERLERGCYGKLERL